MLKKTIIATALISSSIVASSAFATSLQNLTNVNATKNYWLAIGNPATGVCSTSLPGGAGVVAPGGKVTSGALQINIVCGFKYPCTTGIYAFSKTPTPSEKCTDAGVPIATSVLKDLTSGQVTFNSITSGWHVSPGNAVPDSSGTITETISKDS